MHTVLVLTATVLSAIVSARLSFSIGAKMWKLYEWDTVFLMFTTAALSGALSGYICQQSIDGGGQLEGAIVAALCLPATGALWLFVILVISIIEVMAKGIRARI